MPDNGVANKLNSHKNIKNKFIYVQIGLKIQCELQNENVV